MAPSGVRTQGLTRQGVRTWLTAGLGVPLATLLPPELGLGVEDGREVWGVPGVCGRGVKESKNNGEKWSIKG